MTRNKYSAFQKHLLFFSTPTTPPRLTFKSALRAGVSLGLDFPVAVLLSVSLRILYAPFPYFWSPIIVDKIPASSHRTQLGKCHASTWEDHYTCSELIMVVTQNRPRPHCGILDHGSKYTRSHTVSKEDVERFQQGNWEDAVVERRRGRHDVLPLWRGGPIWTGGHSWAVRTILNVRVYETKEL
ncbi:dolichyl-phosphate-mannose mannosyltransferase [Bipolaris maydis]|nr:dolichyl-phosphate-mannose mannosyltransferase [Bipolaris maydis]